VSVLVEVKEKSLDEFPVRVLLRTKKEDLRGTFLAHKSIVNDLPVIYFLSSLSSNISVKNLKKIESRKLIRRLLNFEKSLLNNNFKFGIVYCREGQTREEEMFGNEHGSELFEEFLNLIGDRIKLCGFSGYSGGLDTKDDSSGKESVYTKWRNYQIMFHVSTLMPYNYFTPQQIDRKRHIGNDIVIIIFKEGNNPYFPLSIKSSYNHIIIVVQPIVEKRNTFYRISVGSKTSVSTFSPPIPEPPFIPQDKIKDYLICKAINGERAAYKSKSFNKLILSARTTLLEDIYNKFIEQETC